MDNLTRRRFLTLSGVTAAGALAAGATQVHWSDLLAAAVDDPLPSDDSVLVVITLYGGNDGLNTVVPAADPAYQKARPELAYQPDEVLDLGDGLGLNPGLKGLKGLWDDKKLAIVRGVGYPEPDRSHFRSMAIWQTAAPKSPIPTGWLGRWLDATGADPLRAVSVEPTLPPLLAGATTAAASLPLRGLALPKGAVGTAYAALGKASPGEGLWQAKAAKSVLDLQEVTRVLGTAVKTGRERAEDEDEQRTQGASAGGASQLGAQLELIAGLIEAGVPTRAYSASLGGFDTHADERGTQQRLLTELDTALTPFAQRLAKTDRGKNTVVLVYSEFGRRVEANGSDGTDHGTAGPVFVLGDKVSGGFHGEQPSLTELSNGDLVAGTDFRDVYAAVLQQVLGTDPGKVLAGHNGMIDGLLV
ncbi:DUF1501 domain-containing protein [Kribbella sandramycini]|uniref:DUF1501 domain-containing protein n=1 Tax=Kribbella sandramycini TaxID=60450 RepID=A0A7Y4NY06_9ACTN|nr:DUF1501 domain-containing protein [Kribbella sandramycini]MBB6568088.1 uncharacterized protein (DUF1501 family) [Kribbella sandramycini]NOL39318.1 DUF1501 domain-containing protein [Kribbella sandramycini]